MPQVTLWLGTGGRKVAEGLCRGQAAGRGRWRTLRIALAAVLCCCTFGRRSPPSLAAPGLDATGAPRRLAADGFAGPPPETSLPFGGRTWLRFGGRALHPSLSRVGSTSLPTGPRLRNTRSRIHTCRNTSSRFGDSSIGFCRLLQGEALGSACCGQVRWRTTALLSGLREAVLVGVDDDLHAVAQSQLHEDPCDVGLDGWFAHECLRRDLGVG
jgi:hypothetical protein